MYIMKKLLMMTSAVLVGLVSQATAALTVEDVGASSLATELRSLSKLDWATVVSSGMLSTSVGTFSRNDAVDDGPVTITAGTALTVESIFHNATFDNRFGVVIPDELELDPILLTSLNLTESKKITSDSVDVQELGFRADFTNISPGQNAGTVTSSMNGNVWTYTNETSSNSYLLWLLEDYAVGADGRDDDFNDFIVLGTIGGISAVPEPSTVISLIAVGFLGFVVWRKRRTVAA